MDGAFSCFPGLGGSHREKRHEEKQLQMHGECGREKVVCAREKAKRRVEDGTSMEECDHYHYHYNSDDEEEEEEPQDEAPSLILHDCAPQHCGHGAPGTSSPRPAISPPPQSRRQSRSPPPCPQPSSALRHHHNHCRVSRPHIINDSPPDADSCNYFRWDIALLRALRKDPISNARETGKKRQPGRVDMSFTPKKGDLIIHLDRKQWRRVLEFYDPSFQRLHDGDVLIRIRIDSYSCLGIILMKGTGYMYHRGYWMFLGTDSDQISQCLRGG
ncbi:hypothetical protein R1flu_020619 [Riccia fluitans]|uniref:Uncharacterized protein n=1 Tax=Riccia fluitans TaxID=41844 RepID=A0ABD1ZP44_9MARC